MLHMLIPILSILFLAFNPATDTHAAKRGGTLKVAIEGEAVNLDPIGVGFGRKVYREAIGSGLVRLDKNFNVVGDAAKSWKV